MVKLKSSLSLSETVQTLNPVAWDLEDVEGWIEERKREFRSGKVAPAPGPDAKQRIARPVRSRNN